MFMKLITCNALNYLSKSKYKCMWWWIWNLLFLNDVVVNEFDKRSGWFIHDYTLFWDVYRNLLITWDGFNIKKTLTKFK